MANQNLPAVQKANTIRAYLEQSSVKKELARAVPKHLSVDRLLRVAMTSIQQTPKLLDCTPKSLLSCVMTCASLGLEPDMFLGQAYLVPFFNSKKGYLEAQLIPGYRGYIALARRSGEVQSVSAQVVYTNDEFVLKYGINEELSHVPAEGDRGKPKGAYVVFKYKDGGYSFDYMTVEDIEKIRARSKAGDSGPWVTDFDEMAKKTVIKRHSKLAPLSVEFAKAAALEDRVHAGESQDSIFNGLNGNDVIDAESENGQFEASIPDKTDMKLLNDFLAVCIPENDENIQSIEDVKAEAAQQLDVFWAQFDKWVWKKERESESKTAFTFSAEEQAVYDGFINLRKADNLKRTAKLLKKEMPSWSKELKKVWEDKWLRIMRDPWEWESKESESEPEVEEVKEEGSTPLIMLKCPNTGEWVNDQDCLKCPDRQNEYGDTICITYAKYEENLKGNNQ